MSHAVANFTLHAGDDTTLDITVRDEAGDPVDITLCGLFWALSRVLGSTSILVKEIADGLTVTNASAGQFDIELESDDTQALHGTYYHEARMVDGTGAVSTILSGSVTVEQTQLQGGDLV